MLEPIRVFVGLDPTAEPVAYHVFCQSVIDHATVPVSFTPLCLTMLRGYKETHKDGSNQFIYSRFLIPALCGYRGWAIFFDGDHLCRSDIAELFALRDELKAVQVVKHDYKTKFPKKYLGAKNSDYERKNWSSVMLINCSHFQNKRLTPDVVMNQTGSYLHRFSWLEDRFIGEIPASWNHLVGEQDNCEKIDCAHFTIGSPCFNQDDVMDYKNQFLADEWWKTYQKTIWPLSGYGKESNL